MVFRKDTAPGVFTVLFCCFLALAVCGRSVSGEAVVRYDFEQFEHGKVSDLSGNGYHAEITGEPEPVEGGLRFTGESCLAVPEVDAMNVGGGGFVIEMVVELEAGVPWTLNEDVVLIEGNYLAHPRAWMLMLNENGSLFFNVRDPEWNAVRSADPLPVGEPVHIVGAFCEYPLFETMRREVYVNGAMQGLKLGGAVESDENVRITVGAVRPGRSHFQGIVRELRLFNRSLEGENDPVLARGRRFAGD